MRDTFMETAPSVYGWLEKLNLNYDENITDGAVVLVPVVDVDGNVTVDPKQAGLKDQIVTGLNKFLSESLWRAKSGSNVATFEGSQYIFVPFVSASNANQSARQFGLNVAAELSSMKVENLTILNSGSIDQSQMLVGLVNGLYKCSGFKHTKEELDIGISQITFTGNPDKHGMKKAVALAKSQLIARHLGDAPANWLNPVKFAQIAEELGKDFGFKVTILDKNDIEKEKMGALMAVAQGSANEPRVICIEIEGADNSKTAALVGKGLTFDAGGISLKPGAGMEEMKYDMCGGAAVMGAACYLAQIKPKHKVMAMIGAVENMPGSNATRPGDIVTARNGKTVEVINTDAEGRLVLIDVLNYTIETYSPDLIVNVATLTGACLVALGSVGAAVISKKQNVADHLLEVSRETGEPLWQLPLWDELVKEIKGDFSDYKNLTSPAVKAGTITAGAFLSEFVGDANWAHLDIAGTGWNCAATGYAKKGGSGYGVDLLATACLNLEKI